MEKSRKNTSFRRASHKFEALENPTAAKIEALQAEGRTVQFRPSRDGYTIEGNGWLTLGDRVPGSGPAAFLSEDGAEEIFISESDFVRISK
jgi:hypothetical protein